MNQNPTKKVIIRSPSSDADILVLALHLIEERARVYLDEGTGKNKKLFHLGSFDTGRLNQNALLGFHSFTGNDFVSAFFGKGKKICWEIMKSNPNFVNAFERLGSEWEADDEIKTNIEWYDCKLYGSRKKNRK